MKYFIALLFVSLTLDACNSQSPNGPGEEPEHNPEPQSQRTYYSTDEFVMGADLSYVNQILDHGGSFRDSSTTKNPYKIFADYGTNVIRLRLWHDPEWTTTVYEGDGNPQYNNLEDVTRAIRSIKQQGMSVNLDFHYSDIWADPGTQRIPEAWSAITDLEVLKDSVYEYTRRTLQSLNEEGLMPEYVQIGNETNCGMMFTGAPAAFPALNVCEEHWENAGEVFNSGIRAVREVAAASDVNTRIILHIAQPENAAWWFNNMTTTGKVTDFDIIGLSYYTPWSEIPLAEISDHIADFRTAFGKDVMIVETAYPWTMDNADSYGNIFGDDSLVEGYPASPEGQRDFMIALTREVIDGGGTGIMYWEPAWITSDMKDLWGTGSSWENNTFFNFQGSLHIGIDYMTEDYEL